MMLCFSGFLTGTIRSNKIEDSTTFDQYDFRLMGQPRFAGENFEKNLQLVDAVNSFAERRGCTVGQIALAWLQSQGPDVIPIPGTSSIKHLDQNLASLDVSLTLEELREIDEIVGRFEVVGDRYAHMALTFHGNKVGAGTAGHH